MLVIETEFIAAIETNIGVDFIENGIGKDRIELAELNDFVWREKAYSLDFCSSEENIRSEKNSRSLMKWLKKTRSKSDIFYTLRRRDKYWNRKFLLIESSSNSYTSDCRSCPS